ncbi:hypothetical protein KIN20_009749 [Parelaphostrongylus tenuis]|uniref:Malectin domain-containing protein n=1 Tax=Parelaphostrongylus tenuis TaxID=148309 RepID=A0AAD5MSA3_PARTN|nr:hypothetical protein KIN20_009749 [Parelaphostrongylus tenuis]
MQVFNVHVNNILVKEKFDIFYETHATGLALDLYIDLLITNKQLKIGDVSGYIDRELFIRLTPVVDNPKINAIAVLSGTSKTLPPPPGLPPQPSKRRSHQPFYDEYEELGDYDTDYHQHGSFDSKREFASGPRAPDPFDTRNDNIYVYLGGAIVCLVPVVVLLMRM